MVDEQRRCPRCGALVTAEAEWCGQCFATLREPDPPLPPPMPVTAGAVPIGSDAADLRATPATVAREEAGEAFWPCTVCGARNAIFLDVCETCGTPFAAVMRGTTRRDVDPQAAFTRSLVFPGAGHAMLGYGIDGFARGALFVLSLGIALFLGVAPRTAPMLLAILLTLGLAIGVYVLSAVETKRLAAGGRLIVPSKVLLWVAVGAMFLVVGAIALSVATSGRR